MVFSESIGLRMNRNLTFQPERPDSPDARALIEELDAYLIPLSPPESRHGYAVEKLLAQGVAFFVARLDGAPAGCGGVQLFPEGYAELKRIYVRPAYRGLGLAQGLIRRLEEHAQAGGVDLVRLETGATFADANGLYRRMGYSEIGPFGSYRLDPNSRYFEKKLAH